MKNKAQMAQQLKNTAECIKQRLLSVFRDKKPQLILTVGLLGIVLIFLSPSGKAEQKQQRDSVEKESIGQYGEKLENRLTQQLSSIEGAGRVKVLLTMDCTDEAVYAFDTSERSETLEQAGVNRDEKSKKISSESEYKYILMKGNGSGETGLLRLTVEPKVRGASVVCDGGDRLTVVNAVTQAVAASLGIGANQISVTKMTQDTGG